MSTKEILFDEIRRAPEDILEEVLDFVVFLKSRLSMAQMETAVMSESSLKKDWLKPEEEEAWKDL